MKSKSTGQKAIDAEHDQTQAIASHHCQQGPLWRPIRAGSRKGWSRRLSPSSDETTGLRIACSTNLGSLNVFDDFVGLLFNIVLDASKKFAQTEWPEATLACNHAESLRNACGRLILRSCRSWRLLQRRVDWNADLWAIRDAKAVINSAPSV